MGLCLKVLEEDYEQDTTMEQPTMTERKFKIDDKVRLTVGNCDLYTVEDVGPDEQLIIINALGTVITYLRGPYNFALV